jgi:hypothetical protein
MQVFIAEYAVATGDIQFLKEGVSMLETLISSFTRLGHRVYYPTSKVELQSGNPIPSEDFFESLKLGERFDAGLVIAPDEMLAEATEILEEGTCNLGSPPQAVQVCADKLCCTRVLEKHRLPVPETVIESVREGSWVVKPRWGCGSEAVRLQRGGARIQKGFIATEYLCGEHLSVSLIASENRVLPLAINRQLICEEGDTITYYGSQTPCRVENWEEIEAIASEAVEILGCRGYVGVDIINGEKPCIVDVNPRATTSITPISQILPCEIAELILKAKTNQLPEKIETRGSAEVRVR